MKPEIAEAIARVEAALAGVALVVARHCGERDRCLEAKERARGGKPAWQQAAEDHQEAIDTLVEAQRAVRTILSAFAELREAARPFAEAACHLHPANPDDGVTLDGIEVRHWRRLASLVAEEGAGRG